MAKLPIGAPLSSLSLAGFFFFFFLLLAIVATATADSEFAAPAPVNHGSFIPKASICQNKTELAPGLKPAGSIDQTPMLFAAMEKRQSCPSGYLNCNSWPDLCCQADGNCCVDWRRCISPGQSCCSSLAQIEACDVGQQCCIGGCAPEGSQCCGDENRWCAAGYDCCDNGGCAPENAQCCQRGLDGQPAYCNAGNSCYESTDLDTHPNGIQCCTNSRCTAYVAADGTTRTASQASPPEASTSYYTSYYTSDSTSYYTSDYTSYYSSDITVYWTFTYTWYYYAYFYTVYLSQSVVTSTIDTTTTVFSVLATDEADASSLATVYAASVTDEGPPAAASTQLATVAASEGSVPAVSSSVPTAQSGNIQGGFPSQTSTPVSGDSPAESAGGATGDSSRVGRDAVVGGLLAAGCLVLALAL